MGWGGGGVIKMIINLIPDNMKEANYEAYYISVGFI